MLSILKLHNSLNMELHHQKNLKYLVDLGYCIGCGLCVGICRNPNTEMTNNAFGFYEPKFTAECLDCNDCNYICPFGNGVVYSANDLNENKIFELIYDTTYSKYDKLIGYFRNCYVGYSTQYRLSSSSGGIATWILVHLLENKQVDSVICVSPLTNSDPLFEYKICSNKEEIVASARSHYYPVHLADVIKKVLTENKRYAIVAIPCFLKAIALAQIRNKILSERIVFKIGLFCGGMKSRFFTEYLAAHLGLEKKQIKNPIYRIKREETSSQGYFFAFKDPNDPQKTIEYNIKKLGDLWGPGYFKHKACDFCDDVTAEVSDISLGDAWIKPYENDWRGHSIIITRTEQAESLINDGIMTHELILENISLEKIINSQKANFNDRIQGLSYRLYWYRNKITPKKRVKPKKPQNLIVGLTYKVKSIIRVQSLMIWHKINSSKFKLRLFKCCMFPYLLILKTSNFLNNKFMKN